MVANMISLQFDPFDRTEILINDLHSYAFEKLLEKLYKLLTTKILSKHFTTPFSEITPLHQVNVVHQSIFEDIEDLRCTYKILHHDKYNTNVFLTPNFRQNFDFIGGYDYTILNSKIMYAGNQLGIYLLDELVQNHKTLDKSEKQSLLMKRLHAQVPDETQVTFRCFHGARLNPNTLYTFTDDPRENEP